MALDQTTIGKLVTEQMQALEKDYDDGEEHQIGEALGVSLAELVAAIESES